MRDAATIRQAMLDLLDARLSGVRTQAGEPIVDLVDAVAIEQAKSNVLVEYLRRTNSVAGWRDLLADDTFKADLAVSLGLSNTTLSSSLARQLGTPTTITNDLDALLWYDLGQYGASLGRARKAAVYAAGTERLYLSGNNPFVLVRGAAVKSIKTGLVYETVSDLVGQQPGLDLVTNRYYVDASIRCRTAGRVGNAATNTVVQVMTAMSGVVAVTNLTALEGGADAESNDDFLTALEAGLVSSVNTASGLKALMMQQEGVIDVLVVGPGNDLMVRAVAGAVDLYILGVSLSTVSAVVRVLNDGETVVLPLQPVRSISSVTAGSPLSEGNAFVSSYDLEGAYAGSVRAYTTLTWKPVAQGGPAVGTDVTVTYTYNDLIRNLQRVLDEDPDVNVPGADILVREAERLGLYVDLAVVPYSGVAQATAEAAVSAALSDLIDAKLLGQDLDYSDVVAAAAAATSDGVEVVDRIDNLRMGLSADTLSTANLVVADNQYVRVESVTFRS